MKLCYNYIPAEILPVLGELGGFTMLGEFEGRNFSYPTGFAGGVNNYAHGSSDANPYMFPPDKVGELYEGLHHPQDIAVTHKPAVVNNGSRAVDDGVVHELYVTIAGVTSQKITISYKDYTIDQYVQGIKDGIMYAAFKHTTYPGKQLQAV